MKYLVTTGSIGFPNEVAKMGDELPAEAVAPYLPWLLDIGAVQVVPEPDAPGGTGEASDPTSSGDEPTDSVTTSGLSSMTVAQLKGMAMSFGITPIPALKAELIAAIEAVHESDPKGASGDTTDQPSTEEAGA